MENQYPMKTAILVIAGVVLGALATYGAVQMTGASGELQAQELRGQLEAKEKQLLGYTKYTTLLTVGKQALVGASQTSCRSGDAR